MFKYICLIGFFLSFSNAAFSQNWLWGKWEGMGKERDGSTWSMHLLASKNNFWVSYPSLRCRGRWKLIGFNQYQARFREVITFNKDACEPTGNVTIERLGKNQIRFSYSYNHSRKLDSSAILRRK